MTDTTEQTSPIIEDLKNEFMLANTFAKLESPLLELNRLSLDRTDKNKEYPDALSLLVDKVRTLTLSRNGGPLLVELLLIAPIAARLNYQIPSQQTWKDISESLLQPLTLN